MRSALVLFVIALVSAPPAIHARPKTENLLLCGAALAPPTYFIGVIVHEGSHALTAKLFGADILEFRVLPWTDPDTGAFYFGFVRYQGDVSSGERFAFLIAPKVTDLVLLGTYATLVFADAVPKNRYGQMALAVFATGFWVDFSKDIFAYKPTSDVVKMYLNRGLDSEWERLPFRLLHIGLSVGAGYAVYRGYKGVFARDKEDPAPLMIPILSGVF
jgi:hypothetical protein